MDTARAKWSWHVKVLVFAWAGVLPALGATVYKSVDADGKVSYSDTPPPRGVTAEVIETSESPATTDADAAARLQQMRETTDRLRADRLAREQERAARAPPAYPGYPEEDTSEHDDDDHHHWLVPYYPPYRRWPDGNWPPPPPRPPLVEPEPPSGSGAPAPRGFKGRLRGAR